MPPPSLAQAMARKRKAAQRRTHVVALVVASAALLLLLPLLTPLLPFGCSEAEIPPRELLATLSVHGAVKDYLDENFGDPDYEVTRWYRPEPTDSGGVSVLAKIRHRGPLNSPRLTRMLFFVDGTAVHEADRGELYRYARAHPEQFSP